MMNDSGRANDIGIDLIFLVVLMTWAIPIVILLAIILSLSFRKKQYFIHSIFIQGIPFVYVLIIWGVILLISKIGFP